jgi:gamma-glutamylcyclotransferase (GGCT)/AIG2-like uncharacterized protein YtfP
MRETIAGAMREGLVAVEPSHCFVYGTLKRGQSNYPLIAAAVRAALPATIRGRLYDVGPFPALAHGDETVYGELLLIASEALADLLVVLDDLEGYDAVDPVGSFYLREIVVATTADGREHAAYSYFYNRDIAGLHHLPEGAWIGPSVVEIADPSDELNAFERHVREFRR